MMTSKCPHRMIIRIAIILGIAYLALCYVYEQEGPHPKKTQRVVVVNDRNENEKTRNYRNKDRRKISNKHKNQTASAVVIKNIQENDPNLNRLLRKPTKECIFPHNGTKGANCTEPVPTPPPPSPPWSCPTCVRGGREEDLKSSMVDGYVFNPEGISYVNSHMLTTALVHDFTDFIEAEAHKRMLDTFHDVSYCAISPALERTKDGGYLTAFRVYRCPHRINDNKRNTASKDLVFVQNYDADLRPKGYGYFLGFAYHRFKDNWLWDGPQDPRAFKVNGTVFLLFHAAVYMEQTGQSAIQQPIMWDLERNLPRVPNLKNNPMHKSSDTFKYDKNWMPLEDNNELFFLQTLDPPLVIHCSLDAADCSYNEDVSNVNYPFDWFTALRGGSQFQLWRYPYYIGAVHSLFRNNWNNYVYRAYGAHLVVISLPNFRFVFGTDLLHLNESIFKRTPRYLTFMSDFFFPTSLVVETKDSVLVGGHINDDRSILVRIRGIEKMMEDVIKRDREGNPLSLRPKPGEVQSFFRSRFTQYYTLDRLQT